MRSIDPIDELIEAAAALLLDTRRLAVGSYEEWDGKRLRFAERMWQKGDPTGYRLAKEAGDGATRVLQ